MLEECGRTGRDVTPARGPVGIPAAGPVGTTDANAGTDAGAEATTGEGVCVGRVTGVEIRGVMSGVRRCGGAAPQVELSGLIVRSLPNEPLPPLMLL